MSTKNSHHLKDYSLLWVVFFLSDCLTSIRSRTHIKMCVYILLIKLLKWKYSCYLNSITLLTRCKCNKIIKVIKIDFFLLFKIRIFPLQ